MSVRYATCLVFQKIKVDLSAIPFCTSLGAVALMEMFRK